MLTLIKNAEVFAPESLGKCEVLVAGTQIAAIAEQVDVSGQAVTVVDADGAMLVPGFVDSLTHPAGGGGEGGFANRTAEVPAQAFIDAGVTCPVGALGTDGVTRSLEVLFGSVMSLREQGLSAYMYTGSYRLPAVTICGNVVRDLTLLDPVIGVGEVAIADHRGSQPTAQELRRLAADARLGGVVSGKRGTVMLHVGDGEQGLARMREALQDSELPPHSFYPTHCNRRPGLLDEAVAHAQSGGYVDMTVSTTDELIAAGEVPALEALRRVLAAGAPANRVTLSSDAGGSLPLYQDGELRGIQSAAPDSLSALFASVVRAGDEDLPAVLAALTRNPADALGLTRKGRLSTGVDADLLLINRDSGSLAAVMSRGSWLKK